MTDDELLAAYGHPLSVAYPPWLRKVYADSLRSLFQRTSGKPLDEMTPTECAHALDYMNRQNDADQELFDRTLETLTGKPLSEVRVHDLHQVLAADLIVIEAALGITDN